MLQYEHLFSFYLCLYVFLFLFVPSRSLSLSVCLSVYIQTYIYLNTYICSTLNSLCPMLRYCRCDLSKVTINIINTYTQQQQIQQQQHQKQQQQPINPLKIKIITQRTMKNTIFTYPYMPFDKLSCSKLCFWHLALKKTFLVTNCLVQNFFLTSCLVKNFPFDKLSCSKLLFDILPC